MVRWRPIGRQLVAGRLGPGGARAKGHPTLGLEHPGRGWAEPLGEGGRGGRQKHRGRPPDWNIRGQRPSQAPNQSTRGRRAPARSRVRGGTRERGRRGGPKASVHAEASTVGRMETKEVAGEQGSWGRSTGRTGGRQVRHSPEDERRGGVSGTGRKPRTTGGRLRK